MGNEAKRSMGDKGTTLAVILVYVEELENKRYWVMLPNISLGVCQDSRAERAPVYCACHMKCGPTWFFTKNDNNNTPWVVTMSGTVLSFFFFFHWVLTHFIIIQIPLITLLLLWRNWGTEVRKWKPVTQLVRHHSEHSESEANEQLLNSTAAWCPFNPYHHF